MRPFWPCSPNWCALVLEPEDLQLHVGRIAEVPLVALSVTPDGVYIEADSMLSVDEATALIEQLKLAIAQVPKIEWRRTEGPLGITVVTIGEKE